jgi:glycogenin
MGVYNQGKRHGHQEATYADQSHIHHQRYQPYQDFYHGQEPQEHGAPHHHQEPRPEDFFYAPQPTKIPSNLIREGHYTAVTTSDPKPDYTKVGTVFPWENRSRPAPRRVFPDWDPKPPGLQTPPITTVVEEMARKGYVQPVQPEPAPVPPRRRSPSPPPHVKRKFNPPPSPPSREGGTYVNAWDTDFGIQRYASKLQGRTSPFSPQPWPTHPGQEAYAAKNKRATQEEDEEEFTNWADRAEASSRDGDDEDDEVESPLLSPRSAARRRAAKAKGNSYRHQGVQTDPIITESRGVQVSILTESGNHPEIPLYRDLHKRRTSAAATERPFSFASTNTFVDDPSRELDQSSSYIPAIAPEIQEMIDNSIANAPALKKRESSEDSITTANDSSIISSPIKEIDEEEVGTPKVRISLPEQDDHATSSIPTTSSPVVRRTGRVFSPSTGVDIFKRGSEEVLARFLQQPSGWDTARANAGPPTPSIQ